MDISGYRILHEIGRGGMSTVYLAVQESLDRPVALKVMSHGLAGNQAFKERFLKEGRIVAHLNHRNIVTIHDIGFGDGVSFIAMEYVVGRNLSERIQEGLNPKQCVNIVKRVARALSHAHERGFIHRDIKPSNVLFRNDRDAVLADFGIAKSVQEDKGLTVTGLTPGTPNYMSPEQLRGRPLDGRSDLYSLGVVLYEMLTRERPFDAGTGIATALRHLNEPPPELPDSFSFLRPVMTHLLAKEAEDRFRNGAELIKALDRTIPSRATTRVLDAVKTVFEPEIPLQPKSPMSAPGPVTVEPAATQIERATTIEPAAKSAIGKAAMPESTLTGVQTAPPPATNLGRGITGATATKKHRVTPMAWGMVAVVVVALVITSLLVREFRRNEQDQLAIKQLLIQGKEQLAATHFYAPNGDNAFETYQRVLDLDSSQTAALAGMARVADEAEQDAREARQAGQLDRSLILIEQGLRATPGGDGLLKLRNSMETALAQGRQQRRADVLLAQAERGLEQGRFTQPRGNNAYEAFAAVLKVAPRNEEARAGMERIATRLQQLASDRQAEGELQASLALINEGLTVNPKHEGLLALGTQIRKQISNEHERQRIAGALDQADAQFEAGRRIEPRGDNALETYQSILSKDRDNQQAQNGIAEIAKGIEERARAKFQSGKYGQALVQIDRGMKALPAHTDFLALRAQIASAQEAHEQQTRISALLKQGRQQIADGKYLEPIGDNFLQTYAAIRALDPNNANAAEVLHQIAAHFLTQAREANAAGQAEQALAAVSDGLRFVPDDSTLLILRTRIDEHRQDALEPKHRLAELLVSASAQMFAGHLMVPEGDNAYATYQEVLKRDSQNKAAHRGIAEIAARMYQKAQDMYENGALDEGLAVVKLGLQAEPQNARLKVLENKIEQRAHAALEANQIAHLLQAAEQQLADVKLTLPVGDNALESFQRVLSLDPNNGKARQGLREISNRYAELALAKHAAGDLQAALAMAVRGLSVEPAHQKLQSLRDEIGREIDSNQHARQREVARLLARAQQGLDTGRLTKPRGDSAFEAFQNVLEIDPGNQRAKDGLRAISDRYGQMASDRREDGQLSKGLNLAALGLKVYPDHPGLNALQTELRTTLEGQAERKKALETLYAQAQQQIDEQKLRQPPGDNAYETIQAIWQIDPDDARAAQAREELLSRYEALARAQQRAGALQKSLAFVEEGLEIDPKHATLAALRKSLRREIEIARKTDVDAQAPPVVEVTQPPESEPPDASKDVRSRPARAFGTF